MDIGLKVSATIAILAWSGAPAFAASNTVSATSYASHESVLDIDSYNFDGTTSFFNRNGVSGRTSGGSATASVRSQIVSSRGVPASASAYTNIASGKLGVAAESGRIDGYSDTNSRAVAALVETLTFRVAGATATTITPIVAAMTWHGTMQEPWGQAFATFEGRFGNSQVATTRYLTLATTTVAPGSSIAIFPDGDSITYKFRYDILGAAATTQIMASMLALTHGAAVADFSQTASLSLELPDGVSFTSASGEFLSAAAAVPEPSSWALMLGGFGLMGGMLRRARREAGQAAAFRRGRQA